MVNYKNRLAEKSNWACPDARRRDNPAECHDQRVRKPQSAMPDRFAALAMAPMEGKRALV